MENKCKHCGVCCEVDTNVITLPDIRRWKKEGREDILKHVRMVDWFPAGFKEDKCPFYDKEKEKGCLIEDTKPDVCKQFPLSKRHAFDYTDRKCEIFNKKV